MVNKPRQPTFQLEYLKQGNQQEGYWFLDQGTRSITIGGKVSQVAFRKYYPDTAMVGVVIDGKAQKRSASEFRDIVSFSPKVTTNTQHPAEKEVTQRTDAGQAQTRKFYIGIFKSLMRGNRKPEEP